MTVGEAKAKAKRWVAEEAEKPPGFVGAFFNGSIVEMRDEAEFPLAGTDPGPPSARVACRGGGRRNGDHVCSSGS